MTPFVKDGHAYATDGSIVVRTKSDDANSPPDRNVPNTAALPWPGSSTAARYQPPMSLTVTPQDFPLDAHYYIAQAYVGLLKRHKINHICKSAINGFYPVYFQLGKDIEGLIATSQR